MPRWFKVRNGLPYVSLDFTSVAKHRAMIESNHGMSLEAINRAGGLDWYELWCGMVRRVPLPGATLARDVLREEVLERVRSMLVLNQGLGDPREHGNPLGHRGNSPSARTS